VVAARKVGAKANDLSTRLSDKASGYGASFEKAVDGWAVEGEKVVGRIGDGKVVDEITSKVDLDQAKEQVGKLRDQLEDMLATWRSSFRPEKADTPEKAAAKPATKKPAARKPAAKSTSGSTKASAAKTTKSTAAKASSAKAESAPAEKAS
jgi:hypothetical protein